MPPKSHIQTLEMNGKKGTAELVQVQDLPNTCPHKEYTFLITIDNLQINAVIYQEQLDELENPNAYEMAFDIASKNI